MIGYGAPFGCAIVGSKKISIGAKIPVVPLLGPSAWVTDGQDDQTKWRNHQKKSWQVDCGEGDVFASSLLAQSEKPVVGALYKSGGADSQKLSVAEKFKGQLFQLMQRLESTTPHFIRCIKPNNVHSPRMYEQELVLQQLRCCGVLEVVRISRSGFPTRMTHQKFARR
ncbi:Myosin-1 [Camellia lanceoleosa]|uniref:Myosin-1 n=1 Tax=Camellia lanceoleosa TaxID=1840588 RepID=A0ACC0FDQ7_9ERIC|nr:Myosin-1 [Camellia lanceoleosa]